MTCSSTAATFTLSTAPASTPKQQRLYPRAEGWDAVKFTGVVLQNNKIHDIARTPSSSGN